MSLLESFFSHPEFLVPTMWVTFGCTLSWYLLSAKTYKEITTREVDLLWRSVAKKFEQITKGKRIVGYRCQCGHKHLQKRPIVNFGS
jgi:hypothetical protein